MPWNEFLLPLLAGYVFINLFYLTKFRAQRHESSRLLIESTLCGVVIFALARGLSLWASGSSLGLWFEAWMLHHGFTYPFAGTAVLAAVVALALSLLGNLIVGVDRAKAIIIRDHDNGFLRLFHRAATESLMVSVTLASKKVYIGYIVRTPNLSPEQQFVGLLPLLSGYRDKDTMRLVITTNYAKVLHSDLSAADDFELTFSLAVIETANLFDVKAYPLFGDTHPGAPRDGDQ